METINSVTVSGHVAKDLTDKDCGVFQKTNEAWIVFQMAIGRKGYKDANNEWHNNADFISVKVTGKRAETLKKELVKGLYVAVKGKLRQETWKDSQGKTQSLHRIYAEIVDTPTIPHEKAAPETAQEEYGQDLGNPEQIPFES